MVPMFYKSPIVSKPPLLPRNQGKSMLYRPLERELLWVEDQVAAPRLMTKSEKEVVAPGREGPIVGLDSCGAQMRVRCDAHIGGANSERKSSLGRPDWVRPETQLERPSD